MATKASTDNLIEQSRWFPVIAGGALIVYGLSRRNAPGALIAMLGGSVALAGSDAGKRATRKVLHPAIEGETGGTFTQETITIERPAEDLYEFWRSLQNLPGIFPQLRSVTTTGALTSHWVARGPAGHLVEWDAEILEDEPNRRIVWRSLESSDVFVSGSVEFASATGNRGSIVRVAMQYYLPAGAVGKAVAKVFGDDPEAQLKDALRRFKRLMEAGDIISTDGQPHG